MDSKTLIDSIQNWLHLKSKASVEGLTEPPIPSELFSANQMERHGITLAFSHKLIHQSVKSRLLNRLAESETTLVDSYETLSKKSAESDSFSSAREWLLDNFYLIQEQVQTIRSHLPKGYGSTLPQLKSGMPGCPRVYDIALQIIKHGDGRWDLDNLECFINAYQGVTPLTLGELWALPLMLGIALIENLSNVSKRIVADRNDRILADNWVDRMVDVAATDPKKLVIVIADMARSEPPMTSAFVAALARRLHGAALVLPLSWIEQHLAQEGLVIENLIQEENKQQAADQVTVSNSIASLRRLGEVDWKHFVEATSVVEKILRTDPANIYSRMDFGTRDRYRHVIERLARHCPHSEKQTAETAIQLTQQTSNGLRDNHVGFYLIDKGLTQLENALTVKHTYWQAIKQYCKKRVLPIYLSGIFFVTLALTFAILYKADESYINSIWFYVLGFVVAICSSQLSVSLINLISTLLVKPKLLPRMDFSKGIPDEWKSLVVVPAMLSNETNIDSLVEALEVRFLGNKDSNLYFALLTDFNDASQETLPNDAKLLSYAEQQIADLNQRYSQTHKEIFFLFHRPRRYNDSEKIWMGRERKRGKLTDLNDLLRCNTYNNFSLVVGQTDILSSIKYIITLDCDTQLPRESARELVETMAHPLNHPYVDAEKLRVVDGYGILQPRIAEAISNSGLSRYVQLCGSEFGIDPYTRTVSDVYQDLFHEGSFIGKGIYDVELFQQLLGHRFPDNHILSHDLLEGCYLRSGFISDVALYEKSPSNYLADVARHTRWIRGDWQLISWLLPKVLNANNQATKNPLSVLSKWKLFDNLRRSVVPIALLIFIGFAFTVLPNNYFWLTCIISLMFFPVVLKALLDLLRKPQDMLLLQHITNTSHVIKRNIGEFIIYLGCLPYTAWNNLLAILITCWRVMISKHHLLEWIPSDQIKKPSLTSFAWIKTMWINEVTALSAICILLINNKKNIFMFSLPLILLWIVTPLLMRWLSQPYQRREPKLDAKQINFLHRIARKTWRFFDTFMTVENNWLPPDNFQEAPIEALARRTSPTNIGLALLANLSAYDFGYITLIQLIERTQNTLNTMESLERYHGHFYNWYSTETLQPLLPRYISTVDSGNLAGHLLTLRQGLLELQDVALLNTIYLDGLDDTCDVLISVIHKSTLQSVNRFKQLLVETKKTFTKSWTDALNCCNALCEAATEIIAEFKKHPDHHVHTEINYWSNQISSQCLALQNQVETFANFPNLLANASLYDIAQYSFEDNKIQHDAIQHAKDLIALINTMSEQAFSFAQMDMSFLYDEACHLMTIGFNVDEQRSDASKYDLLSSEARLGNFVAIAQGQMLQDSWFALGRQLVTSGRELLLISWSGSMFEYLMPLLVMPNYPFTLLDQTYKSSVDRQIAYGKYRGIPWGVSESAYNAVDTQFNYLYRAFGVPGLGLKRGLEEDLVIAPYATALALMVAPEAACQNLQRLDAEFATGKYGFYEAIDYTPSRLLRDTKRALIKSFMTHHQGMTLLAISSLLHEQPMQKRFIADPLFQAALLLLQERIPKPTASYLQIPKSPQGHIESNKPEAYMRVFNTPNARTPQVQMLSNGNYHVVITQAGGGYSRWKDMNLTRWREDTTRDNWGMFCYVRDISNNEFWSAAYQPTLGEFEHYKCVFTEAHAEFTRSHKGLDIHTEIIISPEDDMELRRLRIYNRTHKRRTIELTTYAEVVLAPQAADLAQPAFSNLFVETKLLTQQRAILAARRSSDGSQSSPWLCHLMNVYSEQPANFSFETDRARFVGRTRTLVEPLAMLNAGALSNTSGAVLDPIIAIRCHITIEADSVATFDVLTGAAETQERCVELVEKYQDRRLANRIFGLAWTHNQVLLHQLNISEADAQLFEKIASSIIYPNNRRRADAEVLINNRRGQSGLWGYAISGDLPIVLLEVEDAANIELVRQLVKAQAYWQRKGLDVNVVILNGERISYRQSLQEEIMSLVSTATTMFTEHPGSIVVRLTEQVPLEDKILLQTVARVILSDTQGTLKEQLHLKRINIPVMPALHVTALSKPKRSQQKIASLPESLIFFNGTGGFTENGNEYLIRLQESETTPAPWSNVLANPYFGTLVSESGQGYTWIENSQQFRLTPWDNDPLEDTSGEAFYLRDDETGNVWSPTPLPCRGQGDYQIHHGFGYSLFEHIEDGIYSEICMYVALDSPVKFISLKIRNDSLRPRQLSAYGFVAWVLGDLSSKNAMYVVTEMMGRAIGAQNHYNTDFGERTTFFDANTSIQDLKSRTVTGDRTEFLGRNGNYTFPAALKRKSLSGRVGPGLDPCAAIQLTFDLDEGDTREIIFVLGAGKDKQDAENLIYRYSDNRTAETILTSVKEYWHALLKQAHVNTPDPALNVLANGWLLYQVISSRLWARTGYYQSSGAFGFRDQLQDVMSLAHVAPQLFRAQLLLCASHQFEEGDVQHWWHPPMNRGVRTRCSDDYLWLPFALCRYIEATGDISILEEQIPFLQGRELKPDEESYYEIAMVSSDVASMYQHAVRAINHGLKFGEHGLPLMGSGDWNDGMNLVGKDGKGESVWLAFFLFDVLKHFSVLASNYKDETFSERCTEEKNNLQKQIELHGWDGEWYKRAYFDDGSPLGSAENTECRIDSIAQSWAILSGAADLERSKTALTSLYNFLVSQEDGLVKLLTPPFDKSKPNPGYIEGYLPGIRENGGQYTHAAVWAVMAFAEAGEKQLAWQLFNIINPINHGSNKEQVDLYKLEPYVTAGDVYSVEPHTGRGGWSWYTGSAGWLYQLIIEIFLGLHLEQGKQLRLTPMMPDDWNGFSVDYSYGNTIYQITIERGEKQSLLLDDVLLKENVLPLQDDGHSHHVKLTMI